MADVPQPSTSARLDGGGRFADVRGVQFAKRYLRQSAVPIALPVLLLIIVMALFAPLLAPYDPIKTDSSSSLHGPSLAHPFGTDQLGRDQLSRMIYGSRVSLQVGLIAVGLAVVLGVPLGMVAGYFGGFVDHFLMRLNDAIIAFPGLVLALAIIGALGPGPRQVMVALGIAVFPGYARLARGEMLRALGGDYVLAARAIGAADARIMVVHVLPNSMSPIIVAGSLGVAGAILAEAGLSFLGVGVQPPTPTWGGMLSTGLPLINIAQYLSVFPGLAIFVTVLAINVLGDALRDVLDPRLRGS